MSIITTAMSFQREYEGMDEEELTQLREAYLKLGQPVPQTLEDEWQLRTLTEKLEELDDQCGEDTEVSSPANVSDPVLNQGEADTRLPRSLSRRQKACLKAGFVLLIVVTLFPPWSFRYARSSYGFLFNPPFGAVTVNLARLFVEWVLVALLTAGLFLSQSAAPTEQQLKRSWRDHWSKLRQRKFLIPLIIVLGLLAAGLGYYGSRRIARDLPPTGVSKLAGGAYITNYGRFVWNTYNGSDFVLSEVRVSISVFDEKGNAVISNRVYRVPAFDFYPQQTKELSTDVGFALEQGQKWEFYIVGAKGRPE